MKPNLSLAHLAAPIPTAAQHTQRRHRSLPVAVVRGARRIERYCRRRVADCVVVPVLDGEDGRLDLRVGPASGRSGEHLWVRGVDPATLASGAAAHRLARWIRVWIEPPEPARTSTTG